MTYEMKLKKYYFEKIKSGEKIYEIRLNDEKRKLLKVGDFIIFKNENNLKESVKTKVCDLIHFNNFFEMAKTLSSSQIGFAKKSPNEIVTTYHEFYSLEKEKTYGVLAIKIYLSWNILFIF